MQKIAYHIGVGCTVAKIAYANQSKNDAFYEHFRELNIAYRHSMGLAVGEPVHQHRYAEYFPKIDGLPPPPNAEFEMTLRSLLQNLAVERSRNSELKIRYEIPLDIEEWLTHYYGSANSKLATELDLPLKELGYPHA